MAGIVVVVIGFARLVVHLGHKAVVVVNVKCTNDYSVHNGESLHGHCTNERRVRKRDRKVRRDVI